MGKITDIKAREILDSRGNPTVECDIFLENNFFGRASVPSGASTGIHEAIELRDQDKNRFGGLGVRKAIGNILEVVSPKVLNQTFETISQFDKMLLTLDGTHNKSNLGANATLALSLAFAKSLANKKNEYFFSYLTDDSNYILPVPMMNIVNGGSHADNNFVI